MIKLGSFFHSQGLDEIRCSVASGRRTGFVGEVQLPDLDPEFCGDFILEEYTFLPVTTGNCHVYET